MKHLAWTFALTAALAGCAEPITSSTTAPAATDPGPIAAVSLESGTYTVQWVDADGPLARFGVEPGDRVLTCDGQPATSKRVVVARSIVVERNGAQVELAVD